MIPRKRFGQHFLTDPRILERIAGALELVGNETVIEVGPGRGALTDHLVDRCTKLIAIEIDRDLAAQLARRYANREHVRIVQADVLDAPFGAIAGGPYCLIGNVPYYITTPIVFHSLERPRAERMVFLVQREVAERMAAPPASDAYGALSVNLQSLAHVEVLFRVSAGAFNPPPRVDSAVVRLVPRADPEVTPAEEAAFSAFVIAAFSKRRKQWGSIVRSLRGVTTEAAAAMVRAAGLDPQGRPEVFSPAEFAALFRVVNGAASQ